MALTDAELRRQLKACGINPGPITETTRDIYLRRLDKLKENKVSEYRTRRTYIFALNVFCVVRYDRPAIPKALTTITQFIAT